jgi:hypothetical protein
MFSHYLTYLLEKLSFLKVVAARFFIILFRKQKGIEVLYLNYETKHVFANSYLIINYKVRNAIYYRFGNKVTLEKQIKIFDLKNIDKDFVLQVVGFFDSKTFHFKLEPQFILDSSNFKTQFSNLTLKLHGIETPKLSHPYIYCYIKTPIVNIENIKINQSKLKISNTTFNLNEFI